MSDHVDERTGAPTQVDVQMNDFFYLQWLDKTGPVPPSNLYNYDETNPQDDPGREWVLVRRRRRRVENVKDSDIYNVVWQCSR